MHGAAETVASVDHPDEIDHAMGGVREQVRRWDSWHRWVTLALLAHAFLAVTTSLERREQAPTDDGPVPVD